MIAATGVVDDRLIGFRYRRVVAVMGSFANTAGMRRGSGGCQCEWAKISHQREEQQQSGGQAMHTSGANRNPKVAPSIEQNPE
jgi:hypothetical protein